MTKQLKLGALFLALVELPERLALSGNFFWRYGFIVRSLDYFLKDAAADFWQWFFR